MSHIVEIETEVRDEHAVRQACNRLHWNAPSFGSFELFGSSVEGLGVQPPDWRYPIVCDLQSGRLQFDNYNGRWGDPVELDRFRQNYAVEKTKLEARKSGHSVVEKRLADGCVELVVTTN